MKYENPEMMRQLGAEYVLGTLRGPARRRFERLLTSHAQAREQVDFWELRLSEFGQTVPPVLPPAGARSEILRHAMPTIPMRVRREPAPRRRVSWAWPYAAGLATAASLVLAFVLGQRNPPSLPAVPEAASATADAGELPMYAAQLGMPASSMRWLVSVSRDHQQLTVVAGDDFLQVGRHSVQLWGAAPGIAPVPLGLLPNERDASADFDIPASLRGRSQVSFMISLEPAGGSPNDKPGPVMNEAKALDAI